MTNKVYSMMGLATKAGKLFSGDDTCEMYIKSQKAKLVIVAEDASPNTKKKFIDMCKFRGIKIRFYGNKELIGNFIGKDVRAVIIILDKGLATKIEELIDVERDSNGGDVIEQSKST